MLLQGLQAKTHLERVGVVVLVHGDDLLEQIDAGRVHVAHPQPRKILDHDVGVHRLARLFAQALLTVSHANGGGAVSTPWL